MIHEHSRKAYHEMLATLTERQRVIYDYVQQNNLRLTDREIMRALDFNEPNQVRPRITELVQLGLFRECKPRKCDVTRKTVRVVEAAPVDVPAQLSLI
jgi:hypothetical protein